ncbi:MAG: hypothetical protein IT184_16830 [Acidobacteria bacterium]|nr:hypothetical protein [Acidobacteriota bacterium]
MMLPARTFVSALLIAAPVAVLAVALVDRVRDRDMHLALSRVVTSQLNGQVRERCESDPKWFLTGPLEGRPPNGIFISPNPDALEPRPKPSNQGFDLFAYDEQFIGSSSAAPRFPNEFRRELQRSALPVFGTYETDDGAGIAMAVHTGWLNGPCAYFMGRMAPPPDAMAQRVRVAAGTFVVTLLAALAAGLPLVRRVRRLAVLARASAASDYATVALDGRKDELNGVTFVYNDAATELKLRKARIDDLESGLRRFVRSTDEEIAEPLRALEAKLAGGADPREALVDSHALSARVENLIAAARLRMTGGIAEPVPIDLSALLRRVVVSHEPLARASGVSLETVIEAAPVMIDGDERLIARAVANVIDNAIRYNRPGGRVRIAIVAGDGGRSWRLSVVDNGPGVSDELFKGLTAVRRFRGDEGRNRRPGAPGLGLAVAREIADRFGMSLDLSRPSAGGFEAAFAPRAPAGSAPADSAPV